MKKIFFFLSLIISSINLIGQNTLKTKFFSFKGAYYLSDSSYNINNHSNNYEYVSTNEEVGLLISVRSNSINSKAFLDGIKSSGTFDYKQTTFLNKEAIIARMYIDGQHTIHLAFYNKSDGYSIMVISDFKEKMEKAYTDLKNKMTLK